jgi:hypothetical protein
MDVADIIAGLSDAQKQNLTVPYLLIIDNYECVPRGDWPNEMIFYSWGYYYALSELGLEARKALMEMDVVNVKCTECGKFISANDVADGSAQFYHEPLSEFGIEHNEWLCKKCNNA